MNYNLFNGPLNPANEIECFHGTNGRNINSIIVNGFDERLSTGGLYGAGIYFTPLMAKADEFAFGSWVENISLKLSSIQKGVFEFFCTGLRSIQIIFMHPSLERVCKDATFTKNGIVSFAIDMLLLLFLTWDDQNI